MPSRHTIPAESEKVVKITFQPDHESNDYFDIMLIDIPNQIEPKRVYLRGNAYLGRSLFMREQFPFEWRANAEFKKRYEEPLAMLNVDPKAFGPARRKIYLEFSRDEDIVGL